MNFDSMRGVGGVSVVAVLWLFNISGWVEVLLQRRWAYSQAALGVFALLIIAINYQVLITQGLGTRFERDFSDLPRGKQVLTYALGCGVVLATAVFSYYSVAAYHAQFLQ